MTPSVTKSCNSHSPVPPDHSGGSDAGGASAHVLAFYYFYLREAWLRVAHGVSDFFLLSALRGCGGVGHWLDDSPACCLLGLCGSRVLFKASCVTGERSVPRMS